MEQNKQNRVITDEVEEAENQKKQKLEREKELEDLRRILATAEGVRFFKRFFDEARLFQSCFTGNSATYHNEGRRDFGLKFFSDCCKACPEKIPQLMMRVDEVGL